MKRLLTYLTVAIIMLMVPIGTQAWNSLNMRGGSYDWNSNGTGSAFAREDGNTFTKEVTPTSAGNYYFRIYCDDEGDRKQWGPNSDSNDEQIALGSTVNAYQNKTNKAFYFSAEKDVTYIVTAIYKQVDGTWRWTIKVEKKTTASFKKGLYIYGEKYDGTNPSFLHYKLQPVVGTTDEYYFDLFAARLTMSGCNNGNTGNGISDEDNMYFDLNESTFKLAYVANDGGSVTSYGASAGGGIWKLKSTNAESDQTGKKDFGGDYWQLYNVENGGGYYRFYIKVDADGKPSKWWYTSHDDAYVAYKLGESSDWTIDGFYYGKKNGTSFNGNYFGTTNFTQDEDFCFIVGGVWFKRRKSDNNQTYTKNISTDASGLNDLKFEYSDGVYLVELNPTRTDYILKGASPTTPLTVQIIGSAVTPTTITSTDFNAWDLEQRVQMPYNEQEACWKLTGQKLTSGKLMRFLARNVKYDNFGEDGNVPGNGVDTWNNNYVNRNVVGSSETPTGTNIAFTGKTGLYTIRFYAEEDATGNVTYRYTLELEEEINDPDATLSPGTDGGNYTVGDDEEIDLTLTLGGSATTYLYSIGTTAAPPSRTPNDNTRTDFGSLCYDSGSVVLQNSVDSRGSSIVVGEDSKTVYITIQGVDDDGNKGEIHTYQYTFNVLPKLNFSPKGGDFINKVKVTITNGTAPFTYTLYPDGRMDVDAMDAVQDPWSESPIRTETLDTDVREFWLSTPGYLKITDANGKSVRSDTSVDENEEVGDGRFSFTYSTSENYANYYNNGTTSQAVETGGGKDAISVFVKKPTTGNIYVYAWDYTWDRLIQKYQDKSSDLTEEQKAEIAALEGVTQDGSSKNTKQRDPYVRLTAAYPGNYMADSRTMTINGEDYYYLTFSKNKLHAEGDKVGFLVSQGDDNTKTADNMFSDNAYVVYTSTGRSNYITSDPNASVALYQFTQSHTEGYVYFEVPSTNEDWDASKVYCYAYNGNNGNGWPAANTAGNMTLVPGTSNVYYYQVPSANRRNLIFMSTNNIKGTRTTPDKKTGYVYCANGYYRTGLGEGATCATTLSSLTAESATALTKYLNTEPVIVIETQNYPNGEDYYRMVPCDFTYLLDPTWGGTIANPKGVDSEEWSIAHWSGYPAAKEEKDGEKVAGYRKRITTDNLSQTVIGLNQNKTYTVQALVRAEGENNVNLALSLNGATNGDAYHQMKALHASGAEGSYVNKFGRVEYLTPTDWTNKQEGIGWFKLEASAKPNNAGNLVISLTRTNGSYFDLADVTLIEEANDADGKNYHTTAKYAAGDFTGQAVDAASDDYTNAWYADYSERLSTANEQKNNAYSFFDRGKDWNAIVYASDHTVIALDNSLLTAYKDGEKEVDLSTQQHRHPYNVVAVDGDGNKTCDVVYLTDLGGAGETSGTNYYITSHNFGISDNFTTKKVIFDRNFNTATTTLCLPFAITANDLKTILNGGTGTGDVKIYTLNSADLAKNTIEYQLIADEANIAAFTPLIVKGQVAGEHMKNAELLTKDDYDIAFTAPTGNLHTTSLTESGEKTADFNGVTTMTGFYTEGDADGRHWKNFLFNAEDGDDFGKFVWAEPWKGHFSGYIKPFRCYMTLWGDAADGDAKEFSVVWNDTPADPIVEEPVDEPVDEPIVEPEEPGSETTGIASIEQLLKKGNVYTVDGRLVSRNMIAGGLQKGVYMVNGRKFVIK